MTDAAVQPPLDFEDAADAEADGQGLIVELDGFEGPLHLLLALARSQKVDLARIPVAELADQYLAYIRDLDRRRFVVAADYLVMAAWLAYLKSKLLLPRLDRRADEPPAEEMAEALAFRLAKLEALRQASAALQALPRTGRDVFLRGDVEAMRIEPVPRLEGDLYQLVAAYAAITRARAARTYRSPARVEAYPLEAARERLRLLAPRLSRWTPLDQLAPPPEAGGPSPASTLASTFAAGLEMVREGELEMRQLEAFAAVHLRAHQAGDRAGEPAFADVSRAA